MASLSHVSAADAAPESRASEIERLDRAVRRLIEERARLRSENESLRGELEAMRGLQERLLAEGQLRQDAVKRIDDLVALIDRLDPTVATGTADDDGDAK